MENYCSSSIVKVYRISWENSLSNERRKSVLENNVLARIYNSIYFSVLPVFRSLAHLLTLKLMKIKVFIGTASQ